MKFFATPIPYVVLAMACYLFAPVVGPTTAPFLDAAAKLFFFTTALAYDPTAVLSRIGLTSRSDVLQK